MPGLCGIVSPTEDLTRSMSSFRRVHALVGVDYFEASCLSDGCLIANFSLNRFEGLDSQPGRIDGSQAILMLEGEIYNHPELSGMVPHADSSICSTLLALFLQKGPDFIEQLDGEFNIVIYEADSRKLTIFNDHIASYPLYICERPNGFLFGSEKKFLLSLIGERREIDPIGLLQLFMHEHNLRDRTFIKGIRRVPPVSMLTVEDGRVSLSTSDKMISDEQLPTNASSLLDEWRSKLETATAKRLQYKNRLLFSLSAGLDSRAIACAMARNKRPVWARTAGTSESYEVRYAKEIAEKLGFDHFIEDPTDCAYSAGMHKIVWRTEGELQFRHTTSIFTHEKMKSYGDHIIGGWLGDVSSGAHLRPFMFRPVGRDSFLESVFEWYVVHKEADLKTAFNSQFLKEHLPKVKEVFYESYDQFGDVANWRAHELWDLYNRQTRMTISSMPIDSYLFGKVRPFCDRSYLNFVMSIPLRFRLGQSLYKSLIYLIGPEIRSVPNANTNTRLHKATVLNFAGFLWSSAFLVAGKAARRVYPEFKRPLERKAPVDLASTIRSDDGLRQIILDFVHSPNFDTGVFDREGILSILQRHYSGQSDNSILVCILVTLSVALPYFVYEKVERCPAEAEPLGGSCAS